MKIAVPTRGTQVDSHFGNCESYTIFTIDKKQIVKQELLPSPQGCGCKSDIANTLRDMQVSIMLAGNMGQGAVMKIQSAGIEVVRGCSGDVKQVTQAYIDGSVSDSGETCTQHGGEGHECNQH